MYVRNDVKKIEEVKELLEMPTLSYLCSFYWGPKFEDLREMTEEENK